MISPGQKFCKNCGQALEIAAPLSAKYASPQAYTPKHLVEKILTSKSAIEGERKNVTVMFVDVSGFTSISERLDPEEVHEIMDCAFEVILGAVHGFEGTINQFLGDGVMALFGAPIAHEDHPHRGLSAALAIQERLQPLQAQVQRQHGVDFRVRIGINTGPVVVGAIGNDLRMDYTAVGNTTNLAARLLEIAKPGQIVLSSRTQRLREGFFVFEELGEFQLKGKAEPVRAYLLKGEIRGRTRLEVSRERGLTPWCGRAAELEHLMGAYRRAASGAGLTLVLLGEPGLGKSRLLYEFLSRLQEPSVQELEASCQSTTSSIAYYPILQLVRRYLDLPADAGPDTIRARVAERLAGLGPQSEVRRTLVAHFLGVSAPPELLTRLGPQLKDRIFSVFRKMFQRASELAPLVLIVENLHWVDTSSQEFLAYFSKRMPGYPILLVVSARPGYSEPWLKLPSIEVIRLDGLEQEHVHGMIRTLLGAEAVSETLLKLLQAKGEGNPLFVEEIIRQLQETDGIVIEGRKAKLRAASVSIPTSVQDIIAARIDRLAEPVKHTLQVAAVVGRQFTVSLMSRLMNGTLMEHLSKLQSLGFVYRDADQPEESYIFKHALTQEVAYGGLLDRRRRAYHEAIGRGIEELHAGRLEEVAELLAHHFGRSGEAEKAVDYAGLAGEKAQRRWANQEALTYFEDALKRLSAMPDSKANHLRRIDAIIKQAEIRFALGQHAEFVKRLESIGDLVHASADVPRSAAWHCWTGFLHSLIGSKPEIPIAYCREASARAQASGLDEIWAMAESCLTHVYAYAGKLREAMAAGERALPIFEARGNVWWACRTLWGLSLTAIPLGEWASSLKYCHRALELGEAVDDRRLKVVGWWRTGWTHIQQGQVDVGLKCCEEALALSPGPYDAAMIKAVKGYGLVKLGEAETGTTALREAVEWFDRSHLTFTRSWYALWLADSYIRAGDRSSARRFAEEVLSTSRATDYRYFEGMAERLLGAALVEDDPPAAAKHLEAAEHILEELGAQNEMGKTLVDQAEIRRRNDKAAEARRLLQRALAIFERLGTLDEPPRVRAALAALPQAGG